ncbi:uncharacterized protein [Amphiura filiformis]|uniref:uncharacterized protein n=1 Tax=Amphiura filiformis TaxID=82378 RepID=UPI003B223097
MGAFILWILHGYNYAMTWISDAYDGHKRRVIQIRPQTGTWSFVNTKYWTRDNSHVVCRQLGYSFASIQSQGTWNDLNFPEANSPIAHIDFQCTGEEDSLDDCNVLSVEEEEGQEPQIVSVECEDYDPAQDLMNKCGTVCSQETVSRTGCKCDPLCVKYGDCCLDYVTNDNCPPPGVAPTIEETCTPMPLHHMPPFKFQRNVELTDVGYFMISGCSESYRWKDDDIFLQCGEEPSARDPITFTPVQEKIVSGAKRKVYRNVFCAICNLEDLKNLQAWQLGVTNSTEHDVMILDVIPPDDTELPRTCYLNLEEVANCRSHSSIREGCNTYYAPFPMENKVYKNKFCAVCGGEYPSHVAYFDNYLRLPVVRDEINLDCDFAVCITNCNLPGPGTEPNIISTSQPRIFIPELLSLFDFDIGGTNNPCDPGEVFDRFTKGCRLLSCPPDYRLSNGMCVAMRVDPPPVERVFPTGSTSVGGRYEECIKAAWMEQLSDSNRQQGNSTIAAIGNVTVIADTVIVSVNEGFTNSAVTGFNKMFLSWRNISTEGQLFCNASSFILLLNDGNNQEQNYTTDSYSTCVSNIATVGCVSEDGVNLDDINNTVTLIKYSWEDREDCYTVSILWNACIDEPRTPCPEIEFQPDEYEISIAGNATIFIHKESGTIIPSEKFKLGENGTLTVCYSHFHPPASMVQQALSYVSFACFILSLVATFLTFASYCLFKKLRTITGSVIMNFLIAFFVAQLMFLISPRLINPPNLCIASAAVSQFFWLAAFFWMNAVSLVTTSTMSRSTLVRNKSLEMGVLARYMVYAWGGPLIIVGVCVALHFCDCTDIAPIYGRKNAAICWLIGHDGFAVLWGFSAPVAALLLFNVALFLYAVITFRRKMASGKTTKTSSKRIKMEISTYVKLTILMGLPWLLGFVQTIVSNIILNYIYTILNSLQGVLIFWALVLTGRAGKLWRQKVCGRKQASGATGMSSKNKKITVKAVSTSFMTPSTNNTESATNEYH